jgi:putative transposase
MPRKPRFHLPGYPQHVIQRGNNREPCFFEAADFRFYLDSLAKACVRYGCSVHAYVLMTNHVHLMLTPHAEHSISQVMQSLGCRYARYVNHTYQRTGTLWEGRYRAGLVDADGYLLRLYRYIEMNPVRAGMVAYPADYPWSSYRSNGEGKPDPLITPHALYLDLSAEAKTRSQTYRALFDTPLDSGQLQEIRHTVNHELALGNDRFKDKVESMTHRRTRLGQAGRPRNKQN